MGILNKVLIGTLGIVAIIASIPKFMEYNMELNCLYESFVERNRIETFLKMDSIRINNRLIFDIETLYDKINADEFSLVKIKDPQEYLFKVNFFHNIVGENIKLL